MLTQEMKKIILNFSAGSVATVSAEGKPKVSPKATFVILDDFRIAFANIRSPKTVDNLKRDSAVEVCFTDIISRKAVRVTGAAQIIARKEASLKLWSLFESSWNYLIDYVSDIVVISVTAAEMITSPAYDCGFTEEELKVKNLKRISAL